MDLLIGFVTARGGCFLVPRLGLVNKCLEARFATAAFVTRLFAARAGCIRIGRSLHADFTEVIVNKELRSITKS